MAISSSALLPRVGSLKINIRWKPASGALENLKVAGTHSATHFTPVCSLLPMLLNSQVVFLTMALQGAHTFISVCIVLQFVFLSFCANKKGKWENCWRSPRPSKMNCVQLCDVASNRVQPFSVQKVQMALQPARQIFSRPRFLLYQRGAVSQISLAGQPVLLKTMPSHLSVVRLPKPLQKIALIWVLQRYEGQLGHLTQRDGQSTWPHSLQGSWQICGLEQMTFTIKKEVMVEWVDLIKKWPDFFSF